MQRHLRLRTRSEFQAVQRAGITRAHPLVVLRAAPSNDGQSTRFGFVVGRHVAKQAVVRNRVRRRMREVVRLVPVQPGWDIVLIAHREAATADFQAIRQAVVDVLRRARLLAET